MLGLNGAQFSIYKVCLYSLLCSEAHLELLKYKLGAGANFARAGDNARLRKSGSRDGPRF